MSFWRYGRSFKQQEADRRARIYFLLRRALEGRIVSLSAVDQAELEDELQRQVDRIAPWGHQILMGALIALPFWVVLKLCTHYISPLFRWTEGLMFLACWWVAGWALVRLRISKAAGAILTRFASQLCPCGYAYGDASVTRCPECGAERQNT